MAIVAVALMAIGNAAGRICAGVASDKIGRRWTLMLVLLIQGGLMLAAIPVINSDAASLVIVLLATLIGFNYGANLSLFPSYTKDLWGLKTFGMNYGILFTAWGVAGIVGPFLAARAYQATGSYSSAFYSAAGLALIAVVSLWFARPSLSTPAPSLEPAPARG